MKEKPTSNLTPISAALLTGGVLAVARLKAPFTILLADRCLPGLGWAEIALLAAYAALLTSHMVRSADTGRTRRIIWLCFSVVFFAQFVIGVAGVDRFLMTGRLHVPVPAVVIAGPIFRGERFFMPILFASTIVLVGPAWCSYLCYFGSWDGLAAAAKRSTTDLGTAWTILRICLLAATPMAAAGLRVLGVDGTTAGLIAVGFGVIGVGMMVLFSARGGTMVHCTSFCPLGLLGNVLGKISPFRIRIDRRCTECGRCSRACRYNALSQNRIRMRRPGYSCTLCGDCVAACREAALHYSFPAVSAASARVVFLVLVVSLHAVFIGVARI